MKSIRHILVPLDHEAHSREALDWAIAIALRFGAEIALVHGEDAGGLLLGESTVALFTADRVHVLAETLQANADLPIDRVLAALEDLGTPQKGIVIDAKNPAATIVEAARGADLVVMGSHGRKGAPRLLHGSVAETVARDASCPVMIVHERRA
jgi:nucleotide-binding universal stress UspA family protein